jgi:hypothetical protein
MSADESSTVQEATGGSLDRGREERITFLEAALGAALEELGKCYGCPYAQTELHGFVIIRRLERARGER